MKPKFRAWYGAEMYDEPVIHSGEFYLDFRDYIDGDTYDGAVLMQSTGQKDCNNSDIFDADILLEPWTGHVVGRVFYSLGDLAWKVLLVGGGEEFLSDCLDLQVCGNIHEHPHLLEGLND